MAPSSLKSIISFLVLVYIVAVAFASPFSVRQDASSSPTVSPTMSISPSPSKGAADSSDNDVCVDASYLFNYASHQLVHAKHIMADVLCPAESSLPCATPNHMIRIDGKAASYAQYCERYACAENKMEVNSVLSHIWEDENHGNGFELTMFDYRHPENLQIVLHRLTAMRRDIAKKMW